MAYIESHQELRHSPKVARAARLLQINKAQVIGHLQMLWWWAVDHAFDGDLFEFDTLDLAEAADWDGDPDKFVQALVDCGPGSRSGFIDVDPESGAMRLHDWLEYTDALATARESAAKGNHVRWHTSKGRWNRDCRLCRETPVTARPVGWDIAPDVAPDIAPDSGGISTRPDQTQPDQTLEPSSSGLTSDENEHSSELDVIEEPLSPRDEFGDETVDLVATFAKLIADNGHPVPSKGSKAGRDWYVEMGRLLRLGPPGVTTVDPPTPDDVERVMRWATTDTFWRSNIRSVPTLRKQWSQLAIKSRDGPTGNGRPDSSAIADQWDQFAAAAAAEGM